MPEKDLIESQIKKRWIKAHRFIIADYDRFQIKNQKQFADRIGWSDNNLSRAINNDENGIPVRYINKIILEFGVDADWLMTGRGVMTFHPIPVTLAKKLIRKPVKESKNVKVRAV